MHGGVSYYDESSRKYREAKNIRPICKNVKSKGAKDGGARYFDVKTVLMVDKGKVFDFVHDESFEPVIKYGKLSELVRARAMLEKTRVFAHFL